MQRTKGGTLQTEGVVSEKSPRRDGVGSLEQSGWRGGTGHEGGSALWATGTHLAIKSFVPSCILQITLFIPLFDVFVEHFQGAKI